MPTIRAGGKANKNTSQLKEAKGIHTPPPALKDVSYTAAGWNWFCGSADFLRDFWPVVTAGRPGRPLSLSHNPLAVNALRRSFGMAGGAKNSRFSAPATAVDQGNEGFYPLGHLVSRRRAAPSSKTPY